MAEYISMDCLWKCETCFHHRNGKCAPEVWCENGENYRPDYSVLQFSAIEAEPVRWLPVVGYEGLYEVNQWGQIRNKGGLLMRQRLKRAKYTVYKKVSLYKDGEYKHLYVHRLVAQAFIPNPHGFELINHRDEDGTNNVVGNLEWCDRSYNATYGSSPNKISKAFKGKESKKRKAVVGYKDGIATHYASVAEAAKAVSGTTANISAACKGKKKTAYGMVWRYNGPNCGAKMHEENDNETK